MQMKICWEYKDGTVDSIIVEGESIEDLREQANKIIEKRKPENYWSEPV